MNKAFTFRTHYLASFDFGFSEQRKKLAKSGRVIGLLVVDEESGEGEVVLDKRFLKYNALFVTDVVSDFCFLLERENQRRIFERSEYIIARENSEPETYSAPLSVSEPSKGRVPPS